MRWRCVRTAGTASTEDNSQMEFLAVLAAVVIGYIYTRYRSAGGADAASGSSIPRSEAQTIRAPDAYQADPADWVRPFVLYHIAWEMRIAGQGNMPSSVAALAKGELDHAQHQQLMASLQNYLSYAFKRDRRSDDDRLAMQGARDFLQVELRTLNSPTAIRRFIRRSHKTETGTDISPSELEEQFNAIATDVRSNEEAGRTLRNLLLADSVTEMFKTRHEKQIDAFASDLSHHFATGS